MKLAKETQEKMNAAPENSALKDYFYTKFHTLTK